MPKTHTLLVVYTEGVVENSLSQLFLTFPFTLFNYKVEYSNYSNKELCFPESYVNKIPTTSD